MIPRTTLRSRELNEAGLCSSCGHGKLHLSVSQCDECLLKQRERARKRLGITPDRYREHRHLETVNREE
jgi:hypothetical protein